jgi:hypothetical protein
MPPPFVHPKGYYQDAYRRHIRALGTAWTGAQMTSALAWMWKYVATPTEMIGKLSCAQIFT